MRRVSYLLPLLLLYVSPSKAAVNIVNHCAGYNQNIAPGGSVSCTMATAGGTGHKIVISFMLVTATTLTVTATESPTCPGGASTAKNFSGFVHQLAICYIDSAASSASYTVTATINSAIATREGMIEAWDITGLAAGADSVAGGNSANSIGITTVSSGDYIFGYISDHCDAMTPTGSNSQNGQLSGFGTNETGPQYRVLDTKQTAGAAGSYTVGFSSTNSDGADIRLLAAIAFVPSGGSPTPAINIVQRCVYLNHSGGSNDRRCDLTNVQSGNKVVYGSAGNTTNIITDCLAAGSPVLCTCPSASQISQTYGGFGYRIASCYYDLPSNSAVFSAGAAPASVTEPIIYVEAYEIAGLGGGVDAGSEAAAAATSVSYTTAQNNEWTFLTALDNAGNTMTPTNGFTSITSGWFPVDTTGIGRQAIAAFKTTTSSGSNTASYTETGSSIPMISTLSFGASGSTRMRVYMW